MAIETTSTPSEAESAGTQVDTDATITLPRRIVYIQAALLGVIATTFFVFGMMVGSLTSQNDFQVEVVDCTIRGSVIAKRSGQPDAGAVVMILPRDKEPERRLNPKSIHPDSFEAADNLTIQSIAELGGAIVRTDGSGAFSVTVDSPAKYNLFIVSKKSSDKGSLAKKQMAALSTFFMPVEDARKGKAVYLKAVKLDTTKFNLGEIKL